MPKIEREIPYTLSAYSGGLFKDEDGNEDEEEGGITGGKGRGRGAKRYDPPIVLKLDVCFDGSERLNMQENSIYAIVESKTVKRSV